MMCLMVSLVAPRASHSWVSTEMVGSTSGHVKSYRTSMKPNQYSYEVIETGTVIEVNPLQGELQKSEASDGADHFE